MSVDYKLVLRSVSGSRKTQYSISTLPDTAYFPYLFLVNQVCFHKRNPSTRSYASSLFNPFFINITDVFKVAD